LPGKFKLASVCANNAQRKGRRQEKRYNYYLNGRARRNYKHSITLDALLEEHSQQDTPDKYKVVICRPILTINAPLMD